MNTLEILKQKAALESFDERIIPDEAPKGVVSVHLKRYEFIKPQCAGKKVLDAACGVGYGSYALASVACEVTAVDLSEDVIRYAAVRYTAANLRFQVMDACRLSFRDPFDAVISFETIEHLPDVPAYLQGIVKALRKDGFYCVSTPCVPKSTQRPQNPHHLQEWSAEDFRKLLQGYFKEVRLFGQRRKQSLLHRVLQKADFLKLRQKLSIPMARRLSAAAGTTAFSDMELGDLEIVEEDLSRADDMIAVCRKPL